ncbi:DUF2807 domain-containing protein [Mucilaginibacter sp. X4EP1]|jgi:hypothetical protein|uniref:DUF2807 domain-containing protein n=1 Tax=Mucilaginibacter sp. X4EP1 TaxID=2723092 RepID=UPI00216938E3|nr:DUF2807 domain-containing protein [Mucilaginibacter sp. X4EP1]MCS3813148.1 hypothetical protein [Mucilaginibacter sp. X4EP1]
MKTTFTTILTALVLAVGSINLTYAAAPAVANNQYVTVLTGVGAINKIEVHGNVELYISDGATDQVKVYNKYYAESALVQNQNGVLSISSYKAEKLVVWVTAYDLRSITAYDNAEVKSFGNISKIEFELKLHDNAIAHLNLNAFAADVTVNDKAKACLSGTVNDCTLKYNNIDNVDQKDLIAAHESKLETNRVIEKKATIDDLADL